MYVGISLFRQHSCLNMRVFEESNNSVAARHIQQTVRDMRHHLHRIFPIGIPPLLILSS